MTPDNEDADWSGQENLEQRRREEETPRMQNREKIERLNQAIAILGPVFTLPISNGWFV